MQWRGTEDYRCVKSNELVCFCTSSHELSSQLVCSDACFLKFFSNGNGLESYIVDDVNTSEDEVARRQAEEDLRLYGNRPQPAETIDDNECYESVDQTKTQPKQDISEAELADQRPLMMQTISEGETHTTKLVTAMDWNSGASPLDSWLNQSAIPSLLPEPVEEPPQVSMKDLIERETEEIKVFRNVHVSIAPAIETRATHGDNEDFINLSLGAQVYYRNIMDRYPRIPTYLARRLAEGNLERAQRLEARRLEPREAGRLEPREARGLGPREAGRLEPREAGRLEPREARGLGPREAGRLEPREAGRSKPLRLEARRLEALESKRKRRRFFNFGAHRNAENIKAQGNAEKTQAQHNAEIVKAQRKVEKFKAQRKAEKVKAQRKAEKFKAQRKAEEVKKQRKAEKFIARLEAHRLKAEKIKAQRKAEIERRCQDLKPPIPLDILPQMISFRAAIEIPQPLTESDWEVLRTQLRPQSLGLEPPEEQAVNQIESLPYRSPKHESSHDGFWQGGCPRRRPSSADSLHSRSSSMNSSLHGSGKLIAVQSNNRMSGYDPETTRGLPPPPVDISEQKCFECDICGEPIQVRRRREWQ